MRWPVCFTPVAGGRVRRGQAGITLCQGKPARSTVLVVTPLKRRFSERGPFCLLRFESAICTRLCNSLWTAPYSAFLRPKQRHDDPSLLGKDDAVVVIDAPLAVRAGQVPRVRELYANADMERTGMASTASRTRCPAIRLPR